MVSHLSHCNCTISGQVEAKVTLLFVLISLSLQSLEGISDIRDESDRSGMRIVIEVSSLTYALPFILTC